MSVRLRIVLGLIISVFLFGCEAGGQIMDGDGMIRPYEDDYEQEPETGSEVIELKPEKEKAEDITESENAEAEKKYEFINPSGMTLEERIAVPEGYMRSEAANDSLTAFLRAYPMKEYGSEVHYYDGGVKSYAAQIAVFDMFLGDKDLQQCADSVIRIYAEYLKKNGRQDEIAFHFVSGFLCDYKSWLAGNKVSVAGNNVSWIPGTQRTDNEETFEAYLDTVFCYASTISLKKESEYITLGDAKPGDIFIKAGSPGHVVMIADLCEKEGKKAFLLAQGYMPAQDFYILRNDKHKEDPWYYDDEITYPFSTPEYVFDEECLMRPGYQ